MSLKSGNFFVFQVFLNFSCKFMSDQSQKQQITLAILKIFRMVYKLLWRKVKIEIKLFLMQYTKIRVFYLSCDNKNTIRKISVSTFVICCFWLWSDIYLQKKIKKHGKQKKVLLFRDFHGTFRLLANSGGIFSQKIEKFRRNIP